MPILKVLMKMQRRMPCWKTLWSTTVLRQLLILPRKELTPFRQLEIHLQNNKNNYKYLNRKFQFNLMTGFFFVGVITLRSL